MKIYNSLPAKPFGGRTTVGIGVFDGVHLGHRKLLNKVLTRAAASSSIPTVITFHPHPSVLFSPKHPIPLIQPLNMRLQRFKEIGIQKCIVIEIDKRFAATESEDFSSTVLKKILNADSVVVGADFRYGKNAKGNISTLKLQGVNLGFKVYPVLEKRLGGNLISSTLIRKLIHEGEFKKASELLGGYAYAFSSETESGRGRGANLGFATANLMKNDQIIPAAGVYAGWARCGRNILDAAIHIGKRPTFNDTATIEVHLLKTIKRQLNFLEIIPYRMIRPVKRYSTPEKLKLAIANDIKTIKNILISTNSLHFKRHSVY